MSSGSKIDRGTRPSRPRRRARGRADSSVSVRQEILDGAARTFAQRGFAATSVEHILEASGVSRRTFYRFFRNIDEVLEELFTTASMLLIQAIKSAIYLGKDVRERLEYSIEVFLRAPQTVGALSLIFHLEANNPRSQLKARRDAVIQEIVDLLDAEVYTDSGRRIDPLVYRALIAAIEQISVEIYTTTAATKADLQRAKRIMLFMAESALSEQAPSC